MLRRSEYWFLLNPFCTVMGQIMPQNVFFTWVPQISCQNHSVHWGTHTHTHTHTFTHIYKSRKDPEISCKCIYKKCIKEKFIKTLLFQVPGISIQEFNVNLASSFYWELWKDLLVYQGFSISRYIPFISFCFSLQSSFV